MDISSYVKEKFIYWFVLVLLVLTAYVMFIVWQGGMDAEEGRLYVQALTAIATLALLYFAYFNVASKKEEDIARLELAVRPILVWELESQNGGAQLIYKAIKHPIYDLKVELDLGGKSMKLEERHMDVSETNPGAIRKADLSDFIKSGIDSDKVKVLELRFSFHSEVGGKYIFDFTKEVVKKKEGFTFQHRNFVSAKYPWKKQAITFDD